jgi:hypothetical protein
LPSSEIAFNPESWMLHYAIFDFPDQPLIRTSVQKGRSFSLPLPLYPPSQRILSPSVWSFYSSPATYVSTDVPPALQYARILTAAHQ